MEYQNENKTLNMRPGVKAFRYRSNPLTLSQLSFFTPWVASDPLDFIVMAPLIPAADRQRLIDAVNNGSTILAAAQILKIKRASAFRIAAEFRLHGRVESLPRGGRTEENCKADNEMRDFLTETLEENPFLTLKEMSSHLAAQFPVSYKCVDQMLHGLLYTVKLAVKGTDVRVRTNSEATIEARHEYAMFMLNLAQETRTVFLDETGFNLWTRRSQGRALKGRPIRRTVTTQRGPNVSVCMAIATQFGLLHSNVYRGGQTVVRFQEFVDALCERCNQLDQGAQWVMLMDGPNFHRAARVPQQLQNQISIRILPPYSPFLNPVELANSALKARIREMLANPELVEEEAAPPADFTQEEWRFMLLERIAREAVGLVITAEKAARWELGCQRHFGRCLNRMAF